MILQACINGARSSGYHPALPLTLESMIADCIACIDAGANELHVHPRANGIESLYAFDELSVGIRENCPGTCWGVSTGEWIEKDRQATRKAIESWQHPPDYASVNLNEPDAPRLMTLLTSKGIGIEAGLADLVDVERFVGLPECHRVCRILIEIEEQEKSSAIDRALAIADKLQQANVQRPILLHGYDATVWDLVALAKQQRWSTRIGLEDGKHLRCGKEAASNSELVREAKAIQF